MSLRAPSRLSRFARLAVAAAVVVGGAALGAGAAAPAMAAPFSFALSSGNPDFGFAKTGSRQIRNFDILNSGDNAITIDPASLMGLSAPFVASAFSFSAATVIPSNGHATFTVTYTVPAAGTDSTQVVVVTATDQTDLATTNLPLIFHGAAIATDPVHVTATTATGSTVDFGQVAVGGKATSRVTLTVDGVVPVRFSENTISILDTAGVRLPTVNLTASTFGTAGALVNPGMSATFDLEFIPTASGATAGRVVINGLPSTGDAETSSITVTIPLAGIAVTVDPTMPPTAPPVTGTPAPTTPGVTGTPGATSVAGKPGAGRGGSGGSGSGGSLAETGLPAAALVGFAGMLAVGGAAAVFTARRRSALRSGSVK